MNQTKKRLSIINLAISITDIETIQLQILKLGFLKSDQKIQDIISMLQTENYAQAQQLITTYIETPVEEIHQRSTQEDQPQQADDEATIEEFDLFTEEYDTQKETKEEITDLHAFIEQKEETKSPSVEKIDYDSLLNIDADDILPHNIELDITHTPKDTFFDRPSDDLSTQDIPQDTFFDDVQNNHEEEINKEQIFEEEPAIIKNIDADNAVDIQNTSSQYDAISYIDQKFENLSMQYPPVERSEEDFPSVKAWIDKISHQGYTEDEVDEIIHYINKIISSNKAEAAELLLVTASTKSKYAQFQLARALFKGDILIQNIPESFTIINALAFNDNYPEAICDLGQFYEYGIEVNKDKNKAKELYKDAMDLGIKRATEHYKRLSKENEGLFSFFKK